MKYSMSFKTGDGVTVRSEVVMFESDEEALAHARSEAGKSAIVETWKGDNLLIRLEQSKAAVAQAPAGLERR